MAPRWTSALHAQLHLIRFWRSPQGIAFAEQNLGVMKSNAEGTNGELAGDWTGLDLARTEADRLDRSETFYISPEMTQYAEVAARSGFLPQPLKDTDLPMPHGFAFFDRELMFEGGVAPDKDGAKAFRMPIKAVLWRPSVITVNAWPHGERLLGINLSFYATRETIEREERAAGTYDPSVQRPPLVLVNTHGWPFDVDWLGKTDGGDPGPLDAIAQARRYMAAFWALVQQEIVVFHEPQPNDRHTRKQALREKFRGNPDQIRVITLRRKTNRTVERDPDAPHRDFTHRFIRRAHWRQQWYPSLKIHRQIWIDQTIVGDDDLPLLVKDRVFQWTR